MRSENLAAARHFEQLVRRQTSEPSWPADQVNALNSSNRLQVIHNSKLTDLWLTIRRMPPFYDFTIWRFFSFYYCIALRSSQAFQPSRQVSRPDVTGQASLCNGRDGEQEPAEPWADLAHEHRSHRWYKFDKHLKVLRISHESAQ